MISNLLHLSLVFTLLISGVFSWLEIDKYDITPYFTTGNARAPNRAISQGNLTLYLFGTDSAAFYACFNIPSPYCHNLVSSNGISLNVWDATFYITANDIWYVYAATTTGLHIFRVSDLFRPNAPPNFVSFLNPTTVEINGIAADVRHHLLMVKSSTQLLLYDLLTNPAQPTLLTQTNAAFSGQWYGASMFDMRIVAANNLKTGIRVFDVNFSGGTWQFQDVGTWFADSNANVDCIYLKIYHDVVFCGGASGAKTHIFHRGNGAVYRSLSEVTDGSLVYQAARSDKWFLFPTLTDPKYLTGYNFETQTRLFVTQDGGSMSTITELGLITNNAQSILRLRANYPNGQDSFYTNSWNQLQEGRVQNTLFVPAVAQLPNTFQLELLNPMFRLNFSNVPTYDMYQPQKFPIIYRIESFPQELEIGTNVNQQYVPLTNLIVPQSSFNASAIEVRVRQQNITVNFTVMFNIVAMNGRQSQLTFPMRVIYRTIVPVILTTSSIYYRTDFQTKTLTNIVYNATQMMVTTTTSQQRCPTWASDGQSTSLMTAFASSLSGIAILVSCSMALILIFILSLLLVRRQKKGANGEFSEFDRPSLGGSRDHLAMKSSPVIDYTDVKLHYSGFNNNNNNKN